MLDRLYSRIVALAESRHAIPALVLVSFAEASFLPLPPDFLLIPTILARPRRAFLLAGVCTLASVTGGFFGYAIGYFLFAAVGRPMLEFSDAMGHYEALKAAFAQWGVWIILLKGLTPIPFKLLTITSGVLHFNLLAFGLAAVAARGLRFFLLAFLLWRFGAPVRAFIERRLMLVTSLVTVMIVGGFLALRYL
jgi:membrane protein YqaA with SNARE-associated domain